MLARLAGAVQTRLVAYLILAVGVLFLWDAVIKTAVEEDGYQRRKLDQAARENWRSIQEANNSVQLADR